MKKLVRSLVVLGVLLGCGATTSASILQVVTTNFTASPVRNRADLDCTNPYYHDTEFGEAHTIYFTNVVAGVYQLTLFRPVGSLVYTLTVPNAAADAILDAYTLYSAGVPITTVTPYTNYGGIYGVFIGYGGALTNVNGANITGTVPIVNLPLIVLTNNTTGLWWTNNTGIAGNGAGLTGLNASSLASGTISLDRLPTSVTTVLWTNNNGLWVRDNQNNLALGYLCGVGTTNVGSGLVALGLNALNTATGTVTASLFLGNNSGASQTATASYATFVGPKTATNNVGTLNTTVGVGHAALAGFGGTTAFDAVAVGNQALNLFTGDSAVGTVAIGAYAGAQSTNNLGLSVVIGDTAGYQNTRAVDQSVIIGNQALAYNAGAFQTSIAIGYNAQMTNSTDLTNVVALGSEANATKNNQMALGHDITDYVLRDLNYTFPAAQGTGTLTNNGSGVLGWSTNVTYNIPQILLVPTNQIPTSSTGVTNWILCNVSNYGPVLLATNTVDGGYQKITIGTPSAL